MCLVLGGRPRGDVLGRLVSDGRLAAADRAVVRRAGGVVSGARAVARVRCGERWLAGTAAVHQWAPVPVAGDGYQLGVRGEAPSACVTGAGGDDEPSRAWQWPVDGRGRRPRPRGAAELLSLVEGCELGRHACAVACVAVCGLDNELLPGSLALGLCLCVNQACRGADRLHSPRDLVRRHGRESTPLWMGCANLAENVGLVDALARAW